MRTKETDERLDIGEELTKSVNGNSISKSATLPIKNAFLRLLFQYVLFRKLC